MTATHDEPVRAGREWMHAVLVSLAAATIVLAWLPAREVRLVTWKRVDGQARQFQVDTAGPRPERLQRRIRDAGHRRVAADLGRVRWLAEAARFYADSIDESPTVFRFASSSSRQPPNDWSTATSAYWSKVATEAEDRIADATRQRDRWAEQASTRLMVDSRKRRIRDRWDWVGVGVAAALGGSLSLGFARAFPAREPRETVFRVGNVRVRVPADDLRIRQPFGVIVRRGWLGFVVAAGLIAASGSWLATFAHAGW